MKGENGSGFEKATSFQILRQRAEEKVAEGYHSTKEMPASEMSTLIHELRIHQVELEIQNEELRKARLKPKCHTKPTRISGNYLLQPNGLSSYLPYNTAIIVASPDLAAMRCGVVER